ncbi:HAMP domain-containing histidine kinase [bacterium]|nr:HAMP domain-containing histidine kinase [bacterium]
MLPRLPHLPLKHRVRLLWAWWAIGLVLVTFIWSMALASDCLFQLGAKEAALVPKLQQLSASFDALQDKERAVMLSLVRRFKTESLSAKTFEEARTAISPTFRLYLLDAQGRPLDGSPQPPAWLATKALRVPPSASGLITTLGPAPIGYAESFAPLEGEPADYRLSVSRNARQECLVTELDFAYIFGPWLETRIKALRLPPGTTYQHQDHPDARPPLLADKASYRLGYGAAWHTLLAAQSWRFRVDTFSTNARKPIAPLLITVDNGSLLRGVFLRYAAILAGGFAVFGGFAIALRLASRAIRRELELAELRSNFTAMVSHELKTPVAAIGMYAEILEHGLVADEAKIAEYHRIIGKEAARLHRLIDDLLDLGKIERGVRTYVPVATDLNELVRQATHEAALSYDRSAPPVVALALAPALPPAWVDPEVTVRAVSNVVHNALKYGGDPTQVKVTTRQTNGRLLVEIADRGPGIPASKRKAIFEPYTRLEQEERRSHPGTGLGLALVKAFTEGQGGQVEVLGNEGGGSLFRLSFAQEKETKDG